jgi:hypothetical protein
VRKVLPAILFLAACEPFDPVDEKTAQAQAEARGAFEKWLDDTLQGKAEASFAGFSASFRSQWLFERLGDEDSVARDWRGRLTGSTRTDLDLWLEHSRKNRRPRVETLPDTVLRHPSLVELWKTYFALERESVKRQMSRLEIAEVYSDPSGVSILVRNAIGRREMYGMVYEDGTWRIDHQKATFGPYGR